MTHSILDEREWPSNGDLGALGREAQEHRRAWALVGGLSRRLLSERTHPSGGPSTENQNKRIAGLEQTIVKQRRFLAQLEECRAFERETEEILKKALENAVDATSAAKAVAAARDGLISLSVRKGPRSPEADVSA